MTAPNSFSGFPAALVFLLCQFAEAQELKPLWNGAQLRAAAPALRFLSGRSLDMIRNGRAVTYDFQLSLTVPGQAARRAVERFVISYDLWEERFSVTRLSSTASLRRTAANLTQAAVEAWCLEHLLLPTDGLASDRPLPIVLEVRAQDPEQPAPEPLRDSGISLSALIEIFSRPARAQQQRWRIEHAPVRLDAIRGKF